MRLPVVCQISDMEHLCEFYRHLSSASQTLSPALSRYFELQTDQSISKEENKKLNLERCIFCHNKFKTGNHKISIHPRIRLTPKIKRLLVRSECQLTKLGAYQKKMIKDYHQSANQVMVRCMVCRKTSKYRGQTKTERKHQQQEQQQQLQLHQVNKSTETSMKSKRQKKREKAVERRKRQELELGAGLNLPESSACTTTDKAACSRNMATIIANEETSFNEKTQKSTLVDDRLTKSSDTVKPTNINSRNSFIIKPIYSTNSLKSANSNISKLGSNNLGRSCQAGPGNSTAQSLQSGNKSGSKKKKSVKLTQRLGNMLKKEQHKQHGSSLADFLSSI